MDEVLTSLDELKKDFAELKQISLLASKKALTLEDVCYMTGLKRSYLYRLTFEKKIPFYKSAGNRFLYFDKDEITGWLLHSRIKTDAELESEAATHCVISKKGKK